MTQQRQKLSLTDAYKEYCKTEKNPVDMNTYKQVLYMYNKDIVDLMIDKGNRINLGSGIGWMGVAKNKMQFNKLHLDYQAWKKTGIKVFHMNDHSDNWYGFCRWEKKTCRIKNKNKYEFKLTRDNQRRISSSMKEPNKHQIYNIANIRHAQI